MDRDEYTDPSYTQPHVPPGTPPVIDADADPQDAAIRTMANGDSDFSGTNPSLFPRGAEDEEIRRNHSPDELDPDQGDTINPSAPPEIGPDPGDIDEPAGPPDETQPGSTPDEAEPAAPAEMPPD